MGDLAATEPDKARGGHPRASLADGGKSVPGAVLFLDIDGVLNGHERDGRGYCRIQAGPVVHLNRILAETEARLVISSSWRYMVHSGAMTLEGFSYMLITHGIGCHGRLAGVTCRDEEAGPRGAQITRWLDQFPPRGEGPAYVVIDDEDAGVTGAGHPLVRTDGRVGLTHRDADAAIAVLRLGATRPDRLRRS